MSSKDVSIIMAVYNHEATLREALDSALMQEMPYTSVIYCLNDASTDGSGEILNEYAHKHPDRIKVYTSPTNQGCAKRSFLYHRPPVNSRYWCLLEGDDFWTRPDKLAKQIEFLDRNRDFVGCSCNTLMKNENSGEERVIQPSRNIFNLLDLLLLRQRYAFYVHTSSIVWRNIYSRRGRFLPPAFEKEYAHGDFVLMHMMLGKGGKLYNIPEIMSCYRVTGRGLWTSKSDAEKKEITANTEYGIRKSLPLRYKLMLFLWQRLPQKVKNKLLANR